MNKSEFTEEEHDELYIAKRETSSVTALSTPEQDILDNIGPDFGLTMVVLSQRIERSITVTKRAATQLATKGFAYKQAGKLLKAAWSPHSPKSLGLVDELEDCGMVAQ